MANALKTTLLLATMTALLVLLGDVLGGRSGMFAMLGISAVINLGTWWFSDRIVLATSHAQPIDDPRLAWLEQDIAELAHEAGIPKPRVFWVPNEPSPNAFATGRTPKHGVVAVTAGLLQVLDRRQIKSVVAHELGHVAHRDTLISAVAATMAGVITMMARSFLWFGGGRSRRDDGGLGIVVGLLAAILAPIAATLLHLAVSRSREYAADARAARLCHDPDALADALERIDAYGHRIPMQGGNPATHYIANNFQGSMASWFSTHPPMEERVRRLRAMAR